MSQNLRQAALLIHCLHPADATWMLGQLDDTERDRVATLVDELRALGMPAQPELIKSVLAHAQPHPALTALAAMPVPNVVALLRQEPHQLVADVLLQGDRDWRVGILAACEPGQRRAVEALLPGAAPVASKRRAALFAALLETVQENNQAVPPASTRSQRRGWPARWFGKGR